MKSEPDFLRPVRGPHRLAWAALAAALLVLTTAALDAQQAWQARAAAQADARAAELALDAAARPRPPARPADAERDRGQRRAAAKLARPWPALFTSVEGVQAPGIAWLALEVSDSGSLRLEGQAPDAATALAAAETMKHDALWAEVLVSRIEKSATDGAPPRFVISATPRAEAW